MWLFADDLWSPSPLQGLRELATWRFGRAPSVRRGRSTRRRHYHCAVQPIGITSADDERIADYVRLTDVNLRRKLETERGLYLAEGDLVLRRAIGAGHVPRSVLVADSRAEALLHLSSYFRIITVDNRKSVKSDAIYVRARRCHCTQNLLQWQITVLVSE